MRYFDPDLLQTLVAFADTGTLTQAAEHVGRTPSAVTAQMQRLEEQAGVRLFKAVGRGRALTNAGDRLVFHARQILAANKEAWLRVSASGAEEKIGLGVIQDIADQALTTALNRFVRAHGNMRIVLRVGRTAELSQELGAGRIDLMIALRHTEEQDEFATLRTPMRWLAAKDGLAVPYGRDLPIAVLDPPCSFRQAALNALEAHERSYRIAASSQSLAGISAAVRAGVAVTVRTKRWVGKDISTAPNALNLPPLPNAVFSIRVRQAASGETDRLAELLAEDLGFRS